MSAQAARPGAGRLRLWRAGHRGPGGTRAGLLGAGILLAFLLLTLAAPLLTATSPTHIESDSVLVGPSWSHPLGNDSLGRDVLTRLLYSYRVSFLVACTSVAMSLPLGVLIGTVSGYFGRAIDTLLMRPIEMLLAFPALLLALTLVGVLGSGIPVTILATSIIYLPVFARISRAATQVVAHELYVQASRVRGAGNVHVLVRHVIPNASGPVIVQAAIAAAWAIQIEAALSFLGLGVQPPTPSLGTMLAEGQGYLTIAPWIGVFPGVALALTVFAFNLVGDWLRGRLDPGGLAG
jgi:peptide/nickel transport system permease protein